MATEKNKRNSKTNKTVKTVKTVTVIVKTKKEHAPSYNMPIDRNDFDSTNYYKTHGITVNSVYGTGRKQFFAYVPDEGYENASDEEKAEIKKKTDEFSRKVDNIYRTDARKYKKIKKHENVSIDGLLEAGYDPSIDPIDVAIKIINKMDEAEENEQLKTEDGLSEETSEDSVDDTFDAYDDNDCFFNGSTKARGGYSSDGDLSNPEYLVARQQLWNKLHELVDELEGEEREIINMILEDKSIAKKAKELGVPKTTLNDHKNELFARLREVLKDYR